MTDTVGPSTQQMEPEPGEQPDTGDLALTPTALALAATLKRLCDSKVLEDVRDKLDLDLARDDLDEPRCDAALLSKKQLYRVLDNARTQADRIASHGAVAAHPGLALWQLSRPGYLRDLVDRQAKSSLGIFILTPVAVTWLVLGLVEAGYALEFSAQPVVSRPPFFAYWMAAPLWKGPAALSALVVATVVALMWLAARSRREQERIDGLDAVVRSWEIALQDRVELLRSFAEEEVRGRRPDTALSDAARAMEQAAASTQAAATALASAGPLVRDLGTKIKSLDAAVGKLAAATPALGKQVLALHAVDASLTATASRAKTQLDQAAENTATSLRDAAADTATTLTAAASRTAAALKAGGEAVTGQLRTAGEAVTQELTATKEAVDAQLTASGEAVAGQLKASGDAVAEQLRTSGEAVAGKLSRTGEALAGTLGATAASIDSRLDETVAKIVEKLQAAVERISEQTQPITATISDTAAAAGNMLRAAEVVQEALTAASAQLKDVREVTDHAAVFRETLEEARKPFVDATTQLTETADGFAKTERTLRSAMTGVREVIEKLEWYALVADAVHADARGHSSGPGGQK
ncbi:MAG: hypothetical protein AB7V44_31300 [Pseudonocardia sp.]